MSIEPIEPKESDYTTEVPYTKTRKITIAEMIETPEFKSLEPLFASRILELIRANPSVGILQGGGSREEPTVTKLFYDNYKKMAKEPNYENDPAVYAQIRAGKIKWNPEDGKWYRRATSKTVAVPGASWHTGGYAVDLTGNVNLAGRVAEKYNLEQVLGTNETHHFQPVGLPTAKRMYTYIKQTYGIDAIKTPLSPDILLFINENVASNVPRQPEKIKKVLDSLVKKFNTEYGTDIPTAASSIFTVSGRQKSKVDVPWKDVKKTTSTTISKSIVVPTTSVKPTTTTSSLAPTTTTLPSTTTTSVAPKYGSARQFEDSMPISTPTTTSSLAPTTTTLPATTTSTVAPSTTSTTLPSTTTTSVPSKYGSARQFEESMPISTPSTTTTTTMEEPEVAPTSKNTKASSAPTTMPVARPAKVTPSTSTVPPSPPTTIPASAATVPVSPTPTIPGTADIGAGDVFGPTGGITYAGGINPSYKGLTASPDYVGADKDKPYFYTNDDWQTLLGYSPDKIIAIQNQLMKAFPGFVPGAVGDKRDAKTIAMFKKALGQINYLTQEQDSPFRGKKLEDALTELTKNPIASSTSSRALPSYQVTNPADLKAVFKKAAQDAIGRSLGEGDLNRLVESFQSQQIQYQKQSAVGGLAVVPPSAETFVGRSLEKDFGQEVNTQKLGSIFSAIDQALTGGQQ